MTSRICILIYSFFLFSCTIPKDARILKRKTKVWKSSQILLRAWADSPFTGAFLTLRENGKFEHYTSGFIRGYEAGIWSYQHDTIQLLYQDSEWNTIETRKVFIDRVSNTLQFAGDSTPVMMRMRIMNNDMIK